MTGPGKPAAKLALFSRRTGIACCAPWEMNQKLALFFGHFWIKWLILNHIVALFPLKFALFSRFSRARRQSSLPDEPTFVPDTLLPIRPSGLPIRLCEARRHLLSSSMIP